MDVSSVKFNRDHFSLIFPREPFLPPPPPGRGCHFRLGKRHGRPPKPRDAGRGDCFHGPCRVSLACRSADREEPGCRAVGSGRRDGRGRAVRCRGRHALGKRRECCGHGGSCGGRQAPSRCCGGTLSSSCVRRLYAGDLDGAVRYQTVLWATLFSAIFLPIIRTHAARAYTHTHTHTHTHSHSHTHMATHIHTYTNSQPPRPFVTRRFRFADMCGLFRRAIPVVPDLRRGASDRPQQATCPPCVSPRPRWGQRPRWVRLTLHARYGGLFSD